MCCAVGDVDAKDRATRVEGECFENGALVIETQVAETSLQYHDAFVLVGVKMPVWADVRARLHGVDEPVRRECIVRMEVGVLALSFSTGCCLAGLREQGLVDECGTGHGQDGVSGVAQLSVIYLGSFR